MRQSFWQTLGAAVSLPAVLCGEPLIFIGRENPVHLTVSGTVRYDDNIGLTPTDRASDTVFIVSPGLDWSFGGATLSGGLNASQQFIRYGSDTRLNSELGAYSGSLAYEGARASASLQGSYAEIDQTNLRVNSRERSIRRNSTSYSGSGNVQLTPKTSVGSGVNLERSAYPGLGFVDSEAWSFPVDVYYAIRPKLDVSGGFRYGRSSLDGGVGDSDDRDFNLGARGQFTPKLNGQIRVGYTTREEEQTGRDYDAMAVGAALNYAATEKSSLTFSLNNRFESSAIGVSQEVFSVSVGAQTALNPRVMLSGIVDFSSSDYLDQSGRKDDFLTGSLSASYLIGDSASVNMSYFHRRNESSFAPLTFENNVISLSSAVRF